MADFDRTVDDTTDTTDEVSAGVDHDRLVSDADTVGDVCLVSCEWFRSIADAVVAGDRAGLVLPVFLNDSIGLDDLTSRHPIFSRGQVDLVVVDDSVRTAFAQVVLIDTIGMGGDLVSLRKTSTVLRTIDDVCAADAESLSALIQTLVPIVADIIDVSDSIDLLMTFGFVQWVRIDTCVVSDQLGVGLQREATATDTIGESDSVTVGYVKEIAVSDSVTASDSVVRYYVAHRKVGTETVTAPDFMSASIPVYTDRNPFNRAPGVL